MVCFGKFKSLVFFEYKVWDRELLEVSLDWYNKADVVDDMSSNGFSLQE